MLSLFRQKKDFFQEGKMNVRKNNESEVKNQNSLKSETQKTQCL